MASEDKARETILKEIENGADNFNKISNEIWSNPELKHEEKKAHDLLSDALATYGFCVQKNYIIPTAFRAEYSYGSSPGTGPVACVMCEYDALPEVGHACGHNLIAEAGLAAGVAIKAAMEASAIPGKIVVLGTPAEEGGFGKVHLINGGAFKDIDFALMVHPSPTDHLFPPFIAVRHLYVRYYGKAAHAAGYPWEGLNALDAAVACYTNISMMRQQMKPTCRIHGVITKGGAVPNVIPPETELKFYLRAPNKRDMAALYKRAVACFEAAAHATGCKVDYQAEGSSYESLISNRKLAEVYRKHAETFGVKFLDDDSRIIPFVASSDVGNVSHVVPAIQPTYSIGSTAINHSVEFTAAAGSQKAQAPTLIAAKAMALAVVEILQNPSILEEMKSQFKEDMALEESVGNLS